MHLLTRVRAALLLLLFQTPKPAAPFTTPLTPAEMADKQAVVDTTAGTFVIDLRPDLAPNHVGYFIKLARSGAYDGTIFHRVVRLGIIQGGDPLSKDPAKAKQYGTGGLGVLKAEISSEKHTRGAVSAVLQPGKPDSAGSQFFVCVTDQPALDGNYTIFGRVSEGLDVVQKISESPPTRRGVPAERVEIRSVTIRDTPPPEPEPFATESPARPRAGIARCSRRPPGRSPSSSLPTRRRSTCATSCGWPRSASSTGRRSTASCADSSIQTGLADDARPADREAAEAGPVAAAGVQRHEAREGHPLDGARRRSCQRDRRRSSSSPAMRRRSTASTLSLAAWSTVWPSSRRSSSPPVNGEAPVTRIDLKSVRILK